LTIIIFIYFKIKEIIENPILPNFGYDSSSNTKLKLVTKENQDSQFEVLVEIAIECDPK
jgi:hypothetical protein